MFWRMAGLTTASPVETILDKENFTLEELLDEDEVIQECKALNGRLINYLRERAQVEQLLRYIIEEAPEGVEKSRIFKFPFIACEIFTCEVDVILKTLVEDEELMNLLFSFLEPNRYHSALLAGYFSKVVICLMLRKAVPFMNFLQAHQEIFCRLVDLIGITSILEVLIRLIGADEHMYSSYMDSMQWLENTNVLEMIVDKFKSSDSPEVHANAAEALCAITRYAPPGLAAKISSPSFVGRLLRHALEDSRPKSVLVHSLSVCISLLDPRKSSSGPYYMYRVQPTNGPSITAHPETVEGMLESLGNLLKLLDITSTESALETTYGKLQPPFGKHRLKIVEFISILVSIGNEAAEKELIHLGAIHRIVDLFFVYPFNNFLHHQVENIVVSCLESKKAVLIDHLLRDCDLVGKILEAEKDFILRSDPNKPTLPADGKPLPRIANIGHITQISNKLVQLRNNNNQIQEYLQENTDWGDWYALILQKRNAIENVYQWTCGRPTALHDRNRDSDDDDFRDRDYDVAALASNLSQAFQYGIYSNEDIEEAHGSLERDDEDVYFDDESAEVVLSSLRLGEEQDSGAPYTNSNWFPFEADRSANEHPSSSITSASPNVGDKGAISYSVDKAAFNDDLVDSATSSGEPDPSLCANDLGYGDLEENHNKGLEEETTSSTPSEGDKKPEWVEWRETPNSDDPSEAEQPADLPNGELVANSEEDHNDVFIDHASSNEPSSSSTEVVDSEELDAVSLNSPGDTPSSNLCEPSDLAAEVASDNSTAVDDTETLGTEIIDDTETLRNEITDGSAEAASDDVETVETKITGEAVENVEAPVEDEESK